MADFRNSTTTIYIHSNRKTNTPIHTRTHLLLVHGAQFIVQRRRRLIERRRAIDATAALRMAPHLAAQRTVERAGGGRRRRASRLASRLAVLALRVLVLLAVLVQHHLQALARRLDRIGGADAAHVIVDGLEATALRGMTRHSKWL